MSLSLFLFLFFSILSFNCVRNKKKKGFRTGTHRAFELWALSLSNPNNILLCDRDRKREQASFNRSFQRPCTVQLMRARTRSTRRRRDKKKCITIIIFYFEIESRGGGERERNLLVIRVTP